MAMIPLIALATGGLVVGGIIVAVTRRQQERTQAARQLADRLGWDFRESVPFKSISSLDRFELFRQGRARKLRNIMTSPAGEPRVVLFDYFYSTGGGNSQQTHRQTVCYVTSDRLALPSFSLRPERFYHRIASAFGYDDIDLEHRPGFSYAFLLRGEDAAAVRHAFVDDVVDFFDHREGTCAAGVAHELLFWRAGRLLPPDEREALIAEGLELADRFG